MTTITHILDIINTFFEIGFIVVMCLNIRSIYIDKDLKGINVYGLLFGLHYAIFWCFFCFYLGQTYSSIAGIIYFTLNAIWIGMIFFYKYKIKYQSVGP